jgi:hypothetical protein
MSDHRHHLFVSDAELTAAQLGIPGEGDDPQPEDAGLPAICDALADAW